MQRLPLAVIDAGIAGSIVAALAARAGRPVIVIGRAAAHALPLAGAWQHYSADLTPQLWPADVLERLRERLDLRLTIERPLLPLVIHSPDGRRFDDWQDAARRAFSRHRAADHAGGRAFWQAVDRLAARVQRVVGGSGGIIAALQLRLQRGQQLALQLRRNAVSDGALQKLLAIWCRFAGLPAEQVDWPAAASVLAAGGPQRAVIHGGTAALAAALNDALIRDGALLLPRSRLHTIRAIGDGCELQLRDGSRHRVNLTLIDGGRPDVATASLSSIVSRGMVDDIPALQALAGDGVWPDRLSVTPAAGSSCRLVTLQQPLSPAAVAALTDRDDGRRRAARLALQQRLFSVLQQQIPTLEPAATRLAVSVPARRQRAAAEALLPAVRMVLRSPHLSARFGADLIEGIGTARRLL